MFNEKSTKNEHNFASVEVAERGLEYPVVDFANYANICNYHNDESRRRGIISDEMYQEIIASPETIFINSGNFRIPVMIGVNFGLSMGYDSDRCKEYAKDISSDVRILSLPVNELNDDERNQIAKIMTSGDNFALYFSDHNNNESNALNDILDNVGLCHLEKPLIDSRAGKGDGQAAVLLYSCLVEQNTDRGERKKLQLSDVQDYYEKNIGPYLTPDGGSLTTLIMGDNISDSQADEMWDLFDNRFTFLGENHPLSMQDSKEDFFGLLRSDSTMVASTYTKGEDNKLDKLTCFAYFIDDMSQLYWLNQQYIDDLFSAQENHQHTTSIYTPGIVSSGMGKSYSGLSMGLYARAGDEAGLSTNVLFENTNLSKRYIPRMVNNSIKESCKYCKFTPSEAIDTVTYRLWAISNEVE